MTHLRYGVVTNQMRESEVADVLARYEEAALQLSNLIRSIEHKIEVHGKSKSSSFTVRESAGAYDIELHDISTINHQPSTISWSEHRG